MVTSVVVVVVAVVPSLAAVAVVSLLMLRLLLVVVDNVDKLEDMLMMMKLQMRAMVIVNNSRRAQAPAGVGVQALSSWWVENIGAQRQDLTIICSEQTGQNREGYK